MKKRSLLLCIIWMSTALGLAVAQPFKQLTTNLDSFPRVTISFYDRNPKAIQKESVKVFREGEKIAFELDLAKDSVGESGKNVLILFENSYQVSFDRQREYFKALLKSASFDFLQQGDRVYLAEFSWTKRDGKTLIFEDSSAYTSVLGFNNAVDRIKRPASLGQIHQSTEIYLALSESIEFLNKRKDSKPSCIVLLSADFSNIYNSKFSDTEIIQQSRKADIPIYCIRYDRWASKYNTKRLAQESYGNHIDARINNPGLTAGLLSKELNELFKNYFGNIYHLTIDANPWPDGKKHDLQLELNGSELLTIGYNSPDLVAYIMADPKLKYGTLAVTLLLITITILLIVRRSKRRKAEKVAVDKKMKTLSEESAFALRNQEENFKRTLMEKDAQQRAAEVQKKLELLRQDSMTRFSALPRRPVFTDAFGNQTPMDRLIMVIGRDPFNANLRIDDPSVSRYHANISFEQGPDGFSKERTGRFFIWDAGSTNGTFVNEKPLPKSSMPGFIPIEIKNNDILRFGSVSVTFNC